MQAKVLDVPPVVTDQERADEWADQLEDLLLEVGRIFPRADLRRRAAACVRGLLGPLSRKTAGRSPSTPATPALTVSSTC